MTSVQTIIIKSSFETPIKFSKTTKIKVILDHTALCSNIIKCILIPLCDNNKIHIKFLSHYLCKNETVLSQSEYVIQSNSPLLKLGTSYNVSRPLLFYSNTNYKCFGPLYIFLNDFGPLCDNNQLCYKPNFIQSRCVKKFSLKTTELNFQQK